MALFKQFLKTLVTKVYNFIANTSPILEVKLRKLYWYNIASVSDLKPKYSQALVECPDLCDFNQIVDFLKKKWGK